MAARISRIAAAMLVGAAAVAPGGCASTPHAFEARPQPVRHEHRSSAGANAARHALKMVGRPYRYGGSSPASGFDCSGLIQFSYRQAGLAIPRTTAQQRRASLRVSQPRPGDLLFFDQQGKKNSHAGIYVGNGDFVHAPSSGKRVRRDRLDSPYWRRHLSEVRRFGT